MFLSSTNIGQTGRRPDFSLILPLYNPGNQLENTLRELTQFARRTSNCWEFVFVSDGCTDDSNVQIRNWIRGRTDSRLLGYSPNRGKGYAVRQGLLAAHAPYRIFTDIDLAYPFVDIQQVGWRLRGGDDVVIGSRTHPESTIEISPESVGYAWRRHKQSQIFGRVVRSILPLTQLDTQAGLRGFSQRAVDMIAPNLKCNGFGFDCEWLTACHRLGLTVAEIPVHVRCDSGGSTTSFRSTLGMVRDLWRIRRSWPAHCADDPARELREAA